MEELPFIASAMGSTRFVYIYQKCDSGAGMSVAIWWESDTGTYHKTSFASGDLIDEAAKYARERLSSSDAGIIGNDGGQSVEMDAFSLVAAYCPEKEFTEVCELAKQLVPAMQKVDDPINVVDGPSVRLLTRSGTEEVSDRYFFGQEGPSDGLGVEECLGRLLQCVGLSLL